MTKTPTQADREAAASFYDAHLARKGEVPVAAAMRMRHLDESPLIQAFAHHAEQARLEERERCARIAGEMHREPAFYIDAGGSIARAIINGEAKTSTLTVLT